jgi:hypothetical protein
MFRAKREKNVLTITIEQLYVLKNKLIEGSTEKVKR